MYYTTFFSFPGQQTSTLETPNSPKPLTEDSVFLVSVIVGGVTAFCALLAIIVAIAVISKSRNKGKDKFDGSEYSELPLPSNASIASNSSFHYAS